MERFLEYAKQGVANFKLDSCCCIAPIKIGVLAIGYFNWLSALVCLIATANDTFSPTLKKVQEVLMEEASTSLCTLVYGTELTSSVILICAMHRDDVKLLTAYMYYAIASTCLMVIVYSGVIAAIDLLIKLVIIASVVFQCYVILLVRSAVVEIRQRNHTDDIYVYVKNNDLIKRRVDVEAVEKAKSDIKEDLKIVLEKETLENPVKATQKSEVEPKIKNEDKTVKVIEIEPKSVPQKVVNVEKEVQIEVHPETHKEIEKPVKAVVETEVKAEKSNTKSLKAKRKIKKSKPQVTIEENTNSEIETEKPVEETPECSANENNESESTKDDKTEELKRSGWLGFFTRRKRQ